MFLLIWVREALVAYFVIMRELLNLNSMETNLSPFVLHQIVMVGWV
jgi:hypothetical protein